MVKSINGVPVGPVAGESHYEALAKATSDPVLAEGYRKRAKKARKAAK
jgi:hypothetical protein